MMNRPENKVLLIGYGNPGRLDDGLGPALAEMIEESALPGVTVDSDYQLLVEDALEIAKHDIVIFADADVSCDPPFYFKEIDRDQPVREGFSSHSMEPDELVAVARQLFGAKANAYILGIRGYNFDGFGEKISGSAMENLKKAFEFLRTAISEKSAHPLGAGKDF